MTARKYLRTRGFEKDYTLMERRGLDIEKMDKVLDDLIEGRRLNLLRRDHALTGNWAGYRECHISGNWLLIYRLDAVAENDREKDGPVKIVTFVRTGTHSDLLD